MVGEMCKQCEMLDAWPDVNETHDNIMVFRCHNCGYSWRETIDIEPPPAVDSSPIEF